jgi:Holliday junction resolvase RusA-like endonuclease
MSRISFFVPGIPVGKGSGKAFKNPNMKFAVVVQDNAERQKPWASRIFSVAEDSGCVPVSGPISLELRFIMPRPKSHYRANGQLKPGAPTFHTGTPDLDKLIRCVKDALTSVAWKDDKQVCLMPATMKLYGEQPGVYITIQGAEE